MTLKAIFLHGTVVIDGYLIAPLGEKALAAIGLAGAVGGIILGVIFAFSHAMQIRTAQAFGTRDPVFLKSVLVSGIAISLSIGVLGVGAIFVFGGALIGQMAPDIGVATEARAYILVFTLVILGESVGQSLSSYFNGCGRTRIPLYGYCLSVPANIISSIVLIHGLWGLPSFGVMGAAMGSALAIVVQAIFLTSQLVSSDGYLRQVIGWRQSSFAKTIRRHTIFALPIAATFISATLAAHVSMLIFAQMELNAFAALTLILPWMMLAGQVSMQWTQATGIFVAQLLGQRADEAVMDRFLGTAWRGAFIAAAVVASVLLTLCFSVNVLYPDLSTETRAILFGFWPMLLLLQFPRATNAICGNTLRASGDTIYVMHIFLWSQWGFRVPAVAFAVLYLDLSAFWVLFLILCEEVIKFPPFHLRLFRGDWKRAAVLE